MAKDGLPHIFLTDSAVLSDYTSPPRPGPEPQIPRRNRISHSQWLLNRFEQEWTCIQGKKEKRTTLTLPTSNGFYLEFRSKPGHDLITKSLDDMRLKTGVRLLNVRTSGADDSQETIATVYIPAGKERHFINKIEKYANEIDKRSNKPKNYNLVNSIEDIRLAVLESFWQDRLELMPDKTTKWCEIWLRTGVDKEQAQKTISNFKTLCGPLNIEYQDDSLLFPERAVLLVNANKDILANLIESSDSIAEFRLAKETAGFWVELPPSEQAQWDKI